MSTNLLPNNYTRTNTETEILMKEQLEKNYTNEFYKPRSKIEHAIK